MSHSTRPTAQSTKSAPALQSSVTAETSSASSSVTANNEGTNGRTDQVVHRFYLKTVQILGEGRLTHYGNHTGPKGEKKKDKWFNLSLTESDLHKGELATFRSISSFSVPKPGFTEPLNGGTIPPLLIAFILDTSDLPSGQALMWNRENGKSTLDSAALGIQNGKGKIKEKDHRNGIVLERWTLQAQTMPTADVTSSQMAPHTAYRYGIAHFRALFALTRILPAYRLYRRLRRANQGLRLGIKLWSPEGYQNTHEDLVAAWQVMERDLVPLDAGLEQFVTTETVPPDTTDTYTIPTVNLFGTEYSLSVAYRNEVDFTAEDKESVLSEKFNDMDEEWFTPTVARQRADEETSRSNQAIQVDKGPSRRVSNPTAIPTTSPIPQRQQAAAPGSFGSLGQGGSRVSGSRLVSGSAARNVPGSQGSGRWGALAEGLPFGAPSPGTSELRDNPQYPNISSGGAAVAARRLSGHSFNMSSSPSTSLLRSTPPGQQGSTPSARPGSSVGRTSSFLSQSGRSFTHAQLANMSPPVGSSPPVHSPISPTSLSFTKQPVSRSLSGRAHYIPQYLPQSTSPIIPGSMDKETIHAGAAGQSGSPTLVMRYSSSLSRTPARLGSSNSSGDGGLPTVTSTGTLPSNQASQSLLRRTSTRASQESALRHSATPQPEEEEVDSFLSAMDGLRIAPSIPSGYSPRQRLTSTSSSMSGPSMSPSPLLASRDSPSGRSVLGQARAPVTKACLDDTLRKMMGSFETEATKLNDSTSLGRSNLSQRQSNTTATAYSAGTVPSSVGLLTASRPQSETRSSDPPRRLSYQRQSSVHPTSPLAASPARVPLPDSPGPENRAQPRKISPSGQTARSLPGAGSALLAEDAVPQRVTAPPTEHLSPQTTGTSTITNESRASNRRGPVLLRGGFDNRVTKPSSSPSHSPIRDFARMGQGPMSRNVGLGPRGDSLSMGYGYGRKTAGPGQRTAPSSFGVVEHDKNEDEEVGTSRGRRDTRRSEGGMSPGADDKEVVKNVTRLGGDW